MEVGHAVSDRSSLVQAILRQLSRRRQWQLLAIVVTMLFSAVFEVMSLAAVVPFLSLLSEPRLVWSLPAVRAAAQVLHLSDASQLLLPATLLFAVVMMLSSAVRLFNLWLNGRLAAGLGADFSSKAYASYLYQPYAAFTQINSSQILSVVTHQTTRCVDAVNAFLQLSTGLVVAVAIVIAFLFVDWLLAVSAILFFSFAYVFIAFQARQRLSRNGAYVSQATESQMRTIQEGVGALRNVLLDGLQPVFLEVFDCANLPLRRHQMQIQFLEKFPRFFVEGLAMIAMAVFGFFLVEQRGTGAGVIPLLGTFALGSQRLLPALQQVYANWALLRSCRPDVNDLLAVLELPRPQALPAARPYLLSRELSLQSVHYRYAPDLPDVIQGLSLTIQKGERIGVIGATGSGKSTLIDLLMGLLVPTRGHVVVDGIDLHADGLQRHDASAAQVQHLLSSWRAAIAHVPQSIYLADRSFADNIAFGVPHHQIDWSRLRAVAKQAQIATFIEDSPQGYNSFVGERGVRLSGGQRQRIGIARALYKSAAILILDEATSALDTQTEAEIIDGLDCLSRELTIVMIAHRLTTLRTCDRIVRINHGLIESIDTPATMLKGA